MASSQSLRKGQFPIVCQLCEVDMKLTWKCEDCDLLMCDRCREKVHPKFKRAKEHNIIDFKQVGTNIKDLSETMAGLSIKCETHTEQDYCLFCQTCEQLICVSCVTKTHKQHELVEIPEACKIQRKLLVQKTETLETNLVELDEIETRVKQLKDVEMSRYEKTRLDIYRHQAILKNEIDGYTREIIEELDSSHQSVDQALESRQIQVDKMRELIQNRLTQNRNALAEKNSMNTLVMGTRVLNELNQTDEQPPFYLETISVPKFVPSNYKIVKEYFGSLQSTIDSQASTTVFKIRKQFDSNMPHIHNIVACTKYLWIDYRLTVEASLLQQVKQKGNSSTLHIVKSFDKGFFLHGIKVGRKPPGV